MISAIGTFWKAIFGVLFCRCSVTKAPLTLCNPMDRSPAKLLCARISQARILEWSAISFSRGSLLLRDWARISHVGRQRLCPSAAGEPWGLLGSRFLSEVSSLRLVAGELGTDRQTLLGKGVFPFTKSSQTFKDLSSERRLFSSLTRSWLSPCF